MVDAAKKGSTQAVVGSGMRVMSELVDCLPACDGGTIEHQSFGEGFFVDDADVESNVLPLATRIGETKVDVFDVIFLDRREDFLGGLHISPSLGSF